MKAKILAILNSIKNDLADTWQRGKMVILTVLGLIAALEFRAIYEWVIAYINGQQVKKAHTEDAQLKTQEDSANKQADALVAAAQTLPTQEKPVDVDWYKDSK